MIDTTPTTDEIIAAHPTNLDEAELAQLRHAIGNSAKPGELDRYGSIYVVQRLLADLGRARTALAAIETIAGTS